MHFIPLYHITWKQIINPIISLSFDLFYPPVILSEASGLNQYTKLFSMKT